jgi:hypothetical protein
MFGVSLCAVAALLRKRSEKAKAETSLKYMTLIFFERNTGSKRRLKRRLLEARQRQQGISFDEAIQKLGI